jgi:hypothetical protein
VIAARYKRAREIAGLTMGQALRQLNWQPGDNLLEEIEALRYKPSPQLHTTLAALYGVSPAWLRGADPVVPSSVEHLLKRWSGLSDEDRASLLEVIGAIYAPEPR